MPTTIAPLSKGASDYLQSFDLAAVAVSSGGRVYVSRNPKGAAAAYWCKASDAGKICETAWRNGIDAMAAALFNGIVLTPHEIVLRRCAERMSALDETIAEAIDAGTLREFNIAYRKARIRSKRRGQPFPTYSEALRRLRGLLAKSVARQEIPKSFAAVFDERPAPP